MEDGLIIREIIEGEGYIYENGYKEATPCEFKFKVHYTGRICFEIRIDLYPSLKKIFTDQITLNGHTKDGVLLEAKGLSINNHQIFFNENRRIYSGYVFSNGYVELIYSDESPLISSAVCKMTNLKLSQCDGLNFDLEASKVKIKLENFSQDDRWLMQTLETGGVLANCTIEFHDNVSFEEADKYLNQLCSLLSLSQRCYIFPTCTEKVLNNVTFRKRYIEPVFLNSRPTSGPLISDKDLPGFLISSWKKIERSAGDWNFYLALDYYLQSHMIRSVWPSTLGFFTALETFKQAFINHQSDEEYEQYISKKEFHKNLAPNILSVLKDSKSEFPTILQNDDEKLVIRSKIFEINRRGYKSILREMFESLKIDLPSEELNELISFRNNIIHRGAPQEEDSTTSYIISLRFCNLLEMLFLKTLDYYGPYVSYDKTVQVVTHSDD